MKKDGSINLNDMTFKPDGMSKVSVIETQKGEKTATRDYGNNGYVKGKESVKIETTSYIVEIEGEKGRVSNAGDLNGKNRMRFKAFKNQ